MLRVILGMMFGMIVAVAIMIGAPDTAQFLAQIRSTFSDGFDAPLFRRAKEAAAHNLFDPYSAHFTELRKVDTDIGAVVCGFVNAKNRLGAYVGPKPFVYEDLINFAIVESEDSIRAAFKSTFEYCTPNYRKPEFNLSKADKDRMTIVPGPAYPPVPAGSSR
jgi:hypothetical protein